MAKNISKFERLAPIAATMGMLGYSMAGLKTQSLIQAANPKHPRATPWVQAATILFLLSDDVSNIIGAVYATDGGWTTC